MIIRDEILETEETAFGRLHATMHLVPEDRWTDVVSGDWTAKDVLAHIACWLSEAAVHLENIRMGHPLAWPDVEAFNELAHEECIDLTMNEVRAMLAASRHRYREEVAATAPVALNSRLVEALKESSDRHYAEHASDLSKAAEAVHT